MRRHRGCVLAVGADNGLPLVRFPLEDTALAHRASDTNFDRIYQYLKRMPTEFNVLAVRDASLRDPNIRHTAGYTAWAVENHNVLA